MSQVRPPNYSPDQLPETAFTCEDKVRLEETGAVVNQLDLII